MEDARDEPTNILELASVRLDQHLLSVELYMRVRRVLLLFYVFAKLIERSYKRKQVVRKRVYRWAVFLFLIRRVVLMLEFFFRFMRQGSVDK